MALLSSEGVHVGGADDPVQTEVSTPNMVVEVAVSEPPQLDAELRFQRWGPGSRRRKIMQFAWIAAVMGYAALRAVAVGKLLGPKYGINPWHYFAVDFCAAAVEGWATGQAVGFLIDRERKRALPYAGLAALMFIIYIFIAGDHLPWFVFVVIGVIVSITATITVLGIIRKVKAAWAERQAAGCPRTLDG
jgi:hypothetical protein